MTSGKKDEDVEAVEVETEPLEGVVEEEAELSVEDSLRAELEDCQAESQANLTKFLRACADLENYKKRVQKERAEAIHGEKERFFKEFIEIVDNFERAIEHAGDEGDLGLGDGVKLIYDHMKALITRYGLKEVESLGVKFDPNMHEAISHDETDEHAPGVVTKVFQKGYYLNDRLLRPAMVAVAKEVDEGGD